MTHLHRAALLAACLGFSSTSPAAEQLCREISLSYTSGDLGGHLQAQPEGPMGLLDPPRYSYSALGIDGFHQWNLKGRYDYARNRFYLGYDRTRLRREVQIEQSLTIGDNPPHSFWIPMDFSNRLDLYRLGYRRLFEMQALTLAPGAEIIALDFDYQLEHQAPLVEPGVVGVLDPSLISFGDFVNLRPWEPAFTIAAPPLATDRSYTKTALRIGGEVEYRLGERWSLSAEIYDSVSGSGRPRLFSATLDLRFTVFSGQHSAVQLYVGTGRETLRYSSGADNVRAEFRDLLRGGISLSF